MITYLYKRTGVCPLSSNGQQYATIERFEHVCKVRGEQEEKVEKNKKTLKKMDKEIEPC